MNLAPVNANTSAYMWSPSIHDIKTASTIWWTSHEGAMSCSGMTGRCSPCPRHCTMWRQSQVVLVEGSQHVPLDAALCSIELLHGSLECASGIQLPLSW